MKLKLKVGIMGGNSICWWCQAPAYAVAAVVLAFLAISTAITSLSSLSSTSVNVLLPLRAAIPSLRESGFHAFATLIQNSHHLFLHSAPNATIFALHDPDISNASVHHWFLMQLLQYHSLPVTLSMESLLNQPPGTCLTTLLPRKNLTFTTVDRRRRLVEINHVPVSHPDVFIQGPLSIHGVLGPFTGQDSDRLVIPSPECSPDPSKAVEWRRMLRILSAKGFVSFAVGLRSVLDGILEDYPFGKLRSVTVFAPTEFSFVEAPLSVLRTMVRMHLLGRRYNFGELVSFVAGDANRIGKAETLVAGQRVDLRGGAKRLTVNGVEIVAPDMFVSSTFVIHGISRPFPLPHLSTN